MAKTKTTWTEKSVTDFINSFADTEQKRSDSFELLKLMQHVSGHEPKMWGPSIVGFGKYHYKYASGHEGDAPLLGFSPRKAAISLYVSTGQDKQEELISKLGKFKMGKACIYIKKLSDIDEKSLVALMRDTLRHTISKYPTGPAI